MDNNGLRPVDYKLTFHMRLLLSKFLCCHLIRLNNQECSPDLGWVL